MKRWQEFGVVVAALLVGGCAVRFSQRSSWDVQQIQQLSAQLEQFRSLAQLQSGEADNLRQARTQLDQQLSSDDISIGFDERGLVVRVLDRVLFDSGKAKVRKEAYPVLNEVARVLNNQAVGQPVAVEGHTDNEPIKRSGWKDNWELSLARARAVLTYLVQEQGVEPSRVAATGYGEHRPIASNETPDGRRMNRRVEIVVLPQSARAGGGGSVSEPPRADGDATTYTK